MLVCGIDCGLTGAISIIDAVKPGASDICFVGDTPTYKLDKGKTKKGNKKEKTVFDIPAMSIMLSEYKIDYLFLEFAQGRPGQAVQAITSTALGFGVWQGLIVAKSIPYEIASPRKWQAVFNISGKKTKELAYEVSMRLFPDLGDALKTERGKIIDGRADAILIAEYGIRTRRNKGQL